MVIMWAFLSSKDFCPSLYHSIPSLTTTTYLAQSLSRGRTTLVERSAQVHEYWSRFDPYYRDGEGAESFADFMSRVWQVLERLKNSEENFIVIFAHGQFILAVLSWLMGLILDDMQQFRHFLLANKIPNGAIVKVYLQRGRENWFSSFSTSHLSSIHEIIVR
jgi:broad specificity phosphatase PhoE